MLDFCLLSLSLAIPPWVGAMSTIAMAVATARDENACPMHFIAFGAYVLHVICCT